MNMDLVKIEKLLKKYLNAETSLQEENLLRDYFTGNKVAPHLEQYRSMFQYFVHNREEYFTPKIRIKKKTSKRQWIGIAASVALLIGVLGYVEHYQTKKEAEKAYADTQKTLQLIATHMNKGRDAIAQLNKVEQTTRKVYKYKNE